MRKKLLEKFLRFVLVSGVGWLIDFAIYTALTKALRFPVVGANYLSSLVSVTFVFFVSTEKVLENRPGRLSMPQKYLLYVGYQVVLVTAVSFLAAWLDRLLAALRFVQAAPLLAENTKLLAKLLITPVTMLCNFFVLRRITEGKHG